MRKISKKRVALVLKMTIAVGCGSVLASCGNPQNKNGDATLVNTLKQQIASLQAQGNKTNPTTGQPANAVTGSNALNGVWVSDCVKDSSRGNDASGKAIQSYAQAYMFEGTAWFAEYGFWTDDSCGDGGGDMTQPTANGWQNGFGAGYIANMPVIAVPWTGQLSLMAWDAQNTPGSSLGYSTYGTLSATGGSITMPVQLITASSGSTGSGSLKLGDIISGGANPSSATLSFQFYSGN